MPELSLFTLIPPGNTAEIPGDDGHIIHLFCSAFRALLPSATGCSTTRATEGKIWSEDEAFQFGLVPGEDYKLHYLLGRGGFVPQPDVGGRIALYKAMELPFF